MKLKYGISVLLICLCVCFAGYLCIAAQPDANEDVAANTEVTEHDIAILEGMVVAVDEDSLTIRSGEQEYRVLIDAETVREGNDAPAVGDWISVLYNGQLSKSDPAQLTAQRIACHVLEGVVSDKADGQFLLSLSEGGEFLVNYDPEIFPYVQDGMNIRVYYDGASTRSIPAQIAAAHIRMPAISGEIANLTESGFSLIDASGEETIVHLTENTACYAELADGQTVRVTTDGIATLSLPAQVTAVEILP